MGGRLGHFLESLVLLHGSPAPCVRVLGFDAFLGVQRSMAFYIPRPRILRPQKMVSLSLQLCSCSQGFQNSTWELDPVWVYKPQLGGDS